MATTALALDHFDLSQTRNRHIEETAHHLRIFDDEGAHSATDDSLRRVLKSIPLVFR